MNIPGRFKGVAIKRRHINDETVFVVDDSTYATFKDESGLLAINGHHQQMTCGANQFEAALVEAGSTVIREAY
jgi:hypothetical protein